MTVLLLASSCGFSPVYSQKGPANTNVNKQLQSIEIVTTSINVNDRRKNGLLREIRNMEKVLRSQMTDNKPAPAPKLKE